MHSYSCIDSVELNEATLLQNILVAFRISKCLIINALYLTRLHLHSLVNLVINAKHDSE